MDEVNAFPLNMPHLSYGKINPMNQETIDFLLNLNREFYNTYAQSFSSTRYSIQPGVASLLPQLLQAENLLDLGCGNGNLAKALLQAGYSGKYLGVDNSLSLLEGAKIAIPETAHNRFAFKKVDLSAQLQSPLVQPNTIVCFAVIHHFPREPYLRRFFDFAIHTLPPSGKFFLSCWQVKNNPRLGARIQPWSMVSLDPYDLTENDLLLDWRADQSQPQRYRYVHHFDAETLRNTGAEVGFILENEFYSDGREGNLALYQVWRKQDVGRTG